MTQIVSFAMWSTHVPIDCLWKFYFALHGVYVTLEAIHLLLFTTEKAKFTRKGALITLKWLPCVCVCDGKYVHLARICGDIFALSHLVFSLHLNYFHRSAYLPLQQSYLPFQ